MSRLDNNDVRAQLLVHLLAMDYKWAGSSLITFLGKGLQALLAELDAERTDLDLYRTKNSTIQLHKKHAVVNGWSCEMETIYSVDKVRLLRGGYKVSIDLVNYTSDTFSSGTDLWANMFLALTKGSGKRYGHRRGLFQNMINGPRVATTLHTALRCGQGTQVPCYFLRRAIIPLYDIHGEFVRDDSNGDGRFRRKIHSRSTGDATIAHLVPSWRAADGGVRAMLRPGKNKDGYWKGADVLVQFEDAVDAGEEAFPGCEIVFCFDQSCNHTTFAPNALRASSMRLGDKSTAKNPAEASKRGWYIRKGERVVQEMNWTDTSGRVLHKGAQTVFKERGLYRRKGEDGKKFQMDCKCCKKERLRGYLGKLDLARRNCCARRILAAEADFVEQKSQLEELAERRGHLAFFYPKYHCELKHIENYWGWPKRDMRPQVTPGMSKKALECLVNKCLDRRGAPGLHSAHSKECEHYMDAYRKGAIGRLAAFTNKTYRSHRCLPASWFDDAKSEYCAAFGEVAADSMTDVSAVNAARPALGEFGLEEEVGAEEAEAEASEDKEESSDEEHSGPEIGADPDPEVAAETDESEDESDIDESDDAAGGVDDAHYERQTNIANKAIAALLLGAHRPGCAPKTARCG